MSDLFLSSLENLIPVSECNQSGAGSICINKIKEESSSIIEALGFDFYRYSIQKRVTGLQKPGLSGYKLAKFAKDHKMI